LFGEVGVLPFDYLDPKGRVFVVQLLMGYSKNDFKNLHINHLPNVPSFVLLFLK